MAVVGSGRGHARGLVGRARLEHAASIGAAGRQRGPVRPARGRAVRARAGRHRLGPRLLGSGCDAHHGRRHHLQPGRPRPTPRSSPARRRSRGRPTRASCSSATSPTTRFDCSLDGASAVPCRPPFAISGLAPGAHTMTVAMRDRFGTADPTPATWIVDGRPQPGPRAGAAAARTATATASPDARDNCAAARERVAGRRSTPTAWATRARSAPPGDGAGHGRARRGEVLSGEVFIKLPEPRARFQQQAPISGFVPLKGQASLPVGTVVDTRKGRMAMQSTVDGRRIGSGGPHASRRSSRRASSGSASCGPPRARGAKISTDLVLQSAPGAEASCVRTGASGPIKGRGRNTVRGADGDDREGPVPDRRRGRHQHRQRRDLGDQGPLRRDPHRRRQGPRQRAQPRDRQDDHGRRRPLATGQGEAVQRPRQERG